jgi:outer membrane protein assembly factor BamB
VTERQRASRRRTFLRGTAAIAVLSSAGCSGGGGESTTDRDDAGGDGADDSVEDTPTSTRQVTTSTEPGTENRDVTPWISSYGDAARTRATPDASPDTLEPKTECGFEEPVTNQAPVVTESGVFVLGNRIVRVDPPTGETAYERSVPAGRALFVQDGLVVAGGGMGSGRIVAFDAETGDRAWIVEPESFTNVPFPAGEGIGYVGGTSLGVVDPPSGDHLLEVSVQDRIEFAGFGNVLPHPAAETVYVSREGIDAYSLADGSRRWHVDMPTPGTGAAHTPLAAVGDQVYVATARRELVALDRASGEERWRIETSAVYFAIDEERVYAAPTSGSITAYDRLEGSELWTTPFTNRMQGLAAASDALVYVTSTSLRTLSKTDGEQQLSLRMDGPISTSGSAFPVAIAGGNIYFAAGTNRTSGMAVF